jgi:phage gp29-like protein
VKKIYTNPSGSSFIEFSEDPGNSSLYQELATRAAIESTWINLYQVLPNPDPVLRKTGNTIDILSEIKRDPHVSSCSTSRESGIMSRKWKLDRERSSATAVELIESVLGNQNLKLRQAMREIQEAWGYGYQVCEVVWERQGNYLLPVKLVGKPQRWFMFGPGNDLRRKTKDFDFTGSAVEPYKFLPTTYRSSYDNPYGEAQYSMCFWPVTFKKGGLKFWAIFLEKFGMPHAFGKLPRNASTEERRGLLESLSKMVRDAVAVFPDDTSVELKEAASVSGNSDAFAQYARFHDAAISTVLLGHSAAVDATPGKLGGDDTALKARRDIVDNDCEMVSETINTLIQWIHELNPSLGAERPLFSMYEETDVDIQRSERDKNVALTGQVKFKKPYFLKRYDFEDEDIDIVEPPPPAPGPQFSAPARSDGQAEIDSLVSGMPDELLQKQIEEVLKPIIALIELSSNYDEIRSGVAKLYPKLDTKDIEQTIEKAMLLGTVWGRLQNNA